MTIDPEKFHVGDTVRVKNIPGPRMIITGFAQEKNAVANICVKWFDKRSEVQTAWWPAKMLARVAPWIERPGYRMALEKIEAVFGDDDSLFMDHNTTLGMFIDDVLEHTHPSRSPAPESTEEPETVDAGE